eukprot:1136838-Pelagomonas_calceolata.AAC.10
MRMPGAKAWANRMYQMHLNKGMAKHHLKPLKRHVSFGQKTDHNWKQCQEQALLVNSSQLAALLCFAGCLACVD